MRDSAPAGWGRGQVKRRLERAVRAAASQRDRQGGLLPRSGGVAAIRHGYNIQGDLLRTWFCDADGELAFNPATSWAERRYVLDGLGNQKECSYFDGEGRPVLCRDGFAKQKWDHDECGNVTELARLGVDDEPVLDKGGVAKIRLADYDKRGNAGEVRFFGTDDRPTLSGHGVAGARVKYDGQSLPQ